MFVHFIRKDSITKQFVMGILIFSSCVTLFLTVIQLYFDYSRDIGLIDEKLKLIETSYQQSFAESLWVVDNELVKVQMKGILKIPDIQNIEIRKGEQQLFYQGQTKSKNIKAHQFTLSYNHDGRIKPLGTCYVNASLDRIYKNLIDKAIIILVSQGTKTFLVSAFIFFLFYHLIGRHLITIAKYVQNLDLKKEQQLTLKRKKHIKDELFLVTESFNTTAQKLCVSHKELYSANENLKKAIVELKLTEETLRESEDRFSSVAKSAVDAIISIGNNGKIIFWNTAAKTHFGYSKDEVIDKPVSIIIPDRFKEAHNEGIKRILANGQSKVIGKTVEVVGLRKDGSEFPVELSLAMWKLKDDSFFTGIIRDITDRKNAEAKLKENEKKYRVLFESSNDGIILHDLNGIIQDTNNKIEQMLGYEKNELIGMSVQSLHPKSQIDISMHAFGQVKRNNSTRFETQFMTKNKALIQVSISSNIYASNLGLVQGIIRDISKEKNLQAKLNQAQKMESIGTLTGGVAHDFNNIMGIILGNTELALEDVPKLNPAYSNLEEIKTASRRATNIVRQLLSFSRIVEKEMQPIEIGPIIKDGLKFLRSTIPTTIDIEQNIQLTNDTILADPTQINQILMNLCINASQAMEQTGGGIKVIVEKVILDDNSAKNYPGFKSGDHIKIMINDTGPGIDPKIIDQIFDPYFTTKEVGKGSGMGLAVVHGIVKSHNGAIAVDSIQGKGTKFIILFPLTTEKPMLETKAEQKISRGNETILFVDDEISITKMVKRMFERLGYKVETTTSPEEAFERFRSNPDHFDLVISDMTMPQMTGVELSEKLMDIRKNIPIIVCTGNSTLVNEEKAKELGLAAYVMKPIDMQETAQTIRKVLDRK
jgi:PAS domain S-box-containing protein